MFETVTVRKPYEQVVSQIARLIEHGTLAQGERLPSETQLQEQFGVSVRVVREAIKVLEAMGLVDVRHGSGMYVSRNTVPAATRAITLSLTPDERSTTSILEVRLPLEVHGVQLAVERGSPEQTAAIMRAAQRSFEAAETDDQNLFKESDLEFHEQIARASGNGYLRVILAAIVPLLSEINEYMQRFPGSLEIAANQHRRIAAAIAAGDKETAASAMREHIAYAQSARETEQADVSE